MDCFDARHRSIGVSQLSSFHQRIVEYRHRSGPSGERASNLVGEAAHIKSMGREGLQIMELSKWQYPISLPALCPSHNNDLSPVAANFLAV
jgi:hypothetical protein